MYAQIGIINTVDSLCSMKIEDSVLSKVQFICGAKTLMTHLDAHLSAIPYTIPIIKSGSQGADSNIVLWTLGYRSKLTALLWKLSAQMANYVVAYVASDYTETLSVAQAIIEVAKGIKEVVTDLCDFQGESVRYVCLEFTSSKGRRTTIPFDNIWGHTPEYYMERSSLCNTQCVKVREQGLLRDGVGILLPSNTMTRLDTICHKYADDLNARKDGYKFAVKYVDLPCKMIDGASPTSEEEVERTTQDIRQQAADTLGLVQKEHEGDKERVMVSVLMGEKTRSLYMYSPDTAQYGHLLPIYQRHQWLSIMYPMGFGSMFEDLTQEQLCGLIVMQWFCRPGVGEYKA